MKIENVRTKDVAKDWKCITYRSESIEKSASEIFKILSDLAGCNKIQCYVPLSPTLFEHCQDLQQLLLGNDNGEVFVYYCIG